MKRPQTGCSFTRDDAWPHVQPFWTMASAETLTTVQPWKSITALPTARKRVTILQPLVYDHSTTVCSNADQLTTTSLLYSRMIIAIAVGIVVVLWIHSVWCNRLLYIYPYGEYPLLQYTSAAAGQSMLWSVSFNVHLHPSHQQREEHPSSSVA